VVEKSN